MWNFCKEIDNQHVSLQYTAGCIPMNVSVKSDDKQKIKELIEEMNNAWLHGKPEDVSQFLDDNVVFVAPGFTATVSGADVCTDTFKQFVEKAKVSEFATSDERVDVWQDTAVMSYKFKIDYEMSGTIREETGRDLYTLRRAGDTWKIVWRGMLPE